MIVSRVTLGSHALVNKDLDQLQRIYEELGISVLRLSSSTPDAVFHRDVAAWTPWGLIKCRMGKPSRAWEPDMWFDTVGVAPALEVISPGTFEGADLLWLGVKDAMLATGQRTNFAGAAQVRRWLVEHGADVAVVQLPPWHDQHLLGVANAINGLVFSYPGLRSAYSHLGCFRLEPSALPVQEYQVKGANWISRGRTIVLGDAAVATAKMLREDYGVRVVLTPISYLLEYGGGVACATGILDAQKETSAG